MRKIGKGIALLMAVVLMCPIMMFSDATATNNPAYEFTAVEAIGGAYAPDELTNGYIVMWFGGEVAHLDPTAGTIVGGLWTDMISLGASVYGDLLINGQIGEVRHMGNYFGGTMFIDDGFYAAFFDDGDIIPILMGEPEGPDGRTTYWDVVVDVEMERKGEGEALIRLTLENKAADITYISTHIDTFNYQIIDGGVVPENGNLTFVYESGVNLGFGLAPRNTVTPEEQESNNQAEANTNQPNNQGEDNNAEIQNQSDNTSTNAGNKEQGTTADNKADTVTGTTGKGTAPAPQTGDTTVIGPLLVVMLGAVVTISGLCYYKKKKA